MVNLEKVDQLLERCSEEEETEYISLLQEIQDEFRYLPKEALQRISEKLQIPMSQLYSMATFYKSFNLEPRGECEICVCMGTACHVRGAPRILERLSYRLGIGPGETTPDKKYTLETVNCLGTCAIGPLATINGEYHGHLTAAKADKLVNGAGEENEEDQ